MMPSDSRLPGIVRAATVLCAAGLLASCSTLGLSEPAATAPTGSSGSSSFVEFFKNGSSTQPTPAAIVDEADIECPAVEILDGGSAMRQEAGGSVRSQISLGQTARECRKAGGQIIVKIGVEGRALLGLSGSPGTYTAPVRFVVKRGDKIVASKLQRIAVTIPSGDTQASFIAIEDNLAVPASGDEMTILVGLDPTGRGGEAPRKKRS